MSSVLTSSGLTIREIMTKRSWDRMSEYTPFLKLEALLCADVPRPMPVETPPRFKAIRGFISPMMGAN